EAVAAGQDVLDDRFQLTAQAVVGDGAAVELEVLGGEVVAAHADEQALLADLEVLPAYRSGPAAAELDRGTLLVRPLVLGEAQVPVGAEGVPFAERALQLPGQRLQRRAHVGQVALLVRLPELARVVAVQVGE